MLGLPLAFGAPAVLFGLVALPVIWWLLRLTPPRPQTEVFAGFKRGGGWLGGHGEIL